MVKNVESPTGRRPSPHPSALEPTTHPHYTVGTAGSPSKPERGTSRHGQVRNIFVGRQLEMAELMSALDDALSGQGRLVMLVGEPGIGKTRTTQELASYAEQQGAQVLWGRCYEETGAPPYWP